MIKYQMILMILQCAEERWRLWCLKKNVEGYIHFQFFFKFTYKHSLCLIFTKIKDNPHYYRQLRCGESLITLFNCPLKNKYEDAWSDFNYFIYVLEGRKIWHTAHGSYDLQKGRCFFVRRGSCIVEQFFETSSCFIFLFMTDKFICDVLQKKATPIAKSGNRFDPVIAIDDNASVQRLIFPPTARSSPTIL